MRKIPGDLETKLKQRIQTRANNAELALDLWLGRPTTALTSEQFLERQTVSVGAGVMGGSAAVCHPKSGADSTRIYLAYLQNGAAHVVTAATKVRMSAHVWTDTGFSVPATAVSIAFDGTMPRDVTRRIEFKTEEDPWVFWVSVGALYGRKLGGGATVTLAESNCSGVSAIRGMWSDVGGFDFGLVVFFLLSGSIYYRQLIQGEWADAEPVSFGPPGVTWSELSAFRTWDYRVGVQARTTQGDVYELFTQYAGIAKQNTEHLELSSKAQGTLGAIQYADTRVSAHVEVAVTQAGAIYGGLYSTDVPAIVGARNLEAQGDWGRKAAFTFSQYLRPETVAVQAAAFSIVDETGAAFTATSAALEADGKTVTLTFANFNRARGVCQATYTPGSVISLADTKLEATAFPFTPEHLNPPVVAPPKVVEVRNT